MNNDQKHPLPMRPDGMLGRPFAWLMESMNAAAYRQTLTSLDVRSGQNLFEIGFGTGAFLDKAARRMKNGQLLGVDPSPLMLKMAAKRLEKYSNAFDIDLRLGDDGNMRFRANSFHRIAAIHSFQFWEKPEGSLKTILEILKPGGVLCLALRKHGDKPPDWLPNPITKAGRETEETIMILQRIGYSDVHLSAAHPRSDFITARKNTLG